MRITMSFKEFKKYMRYFKSTKVLFASCDQHNFVDDSTINFYLEFQKIVIQESKDAIELIGESGMMRIKKITSIIIDDSCSVLGSVAEISCGYRDANLKYKICLCN